MDKNRLNLQDPTAIGIFTMNQSGSVIEENQSVNEEMELRKKVESRLLKLM